MQHDDDRPDEETAAQPAAATDTAKKSQRLRWATHRAAGAKGDKKRQSLLERAHRRIGSGEKKKNRDSHASTLDSDLAKEDHDGQDHDEHTDDSSGRRIFFNIPLPAEALDENGHPIAHYARNKIRTAKYTPISFVPKNLWFQFHNIANVYFLFIVILGVSSTALCDTSGCAAACLTWSSVLLLFSQDAWYS